MGNTFSHDKSDEPIDAPRNPIDIVSSLNARKDVFDFQKKKSDGQNLSS